MSGSPMPRPPFITGSKRSGTTLLGTIVYRHPEISICVECFFNPCYHYGQVAFWPLAREKNRRRLAHSIAAEADPTVAAPERARPEAPGPAAACATRAQQRIVVTRSSILVPPGSAGPPNLPEPRA